MRLEISTWNRVYRWLQTRAVALACFSVVLFALTSLLNMEARASGPHELNIQGASAFGGDAHMVVGRWNGATPFSVMGRLRDWVRIYDRHGRVIVTGELGYFAQSRDVFRERPNVKYPDGQTRVWLRIFGTPEFLHGGSITLHSANGVLLDQDRIFLR